MLIRNLLRQKTRTLLTLIGIAVGIAAIVTLVALSKGMAANYVEVTGRSDADVTIQGLQEEGQALTIGTPFDEDVLAQIRRLPEVKSASAVLYTMVQVPDAPIFIVYGYEPDQPGIGHFKIVEGQTLGEQRSQRGGKPILLGKVAANKLKKELGDTVQMEGLTFRVVGIYETGVALEDSGGVVSLEDGQLLADLPNQVMFIGLQLHHPQRATEFESRLSRILPRNVEIAGTEVGSMMRDMLELMDVYAWGVALIAALVGGVGMMNTMLMSVFERTREIGVLRAVGWRKRHVLTMILGESWILSAVGGLIGIGIGTLLTRLVANLPTMAGLTRGDVPPSLSLQAFATAMLLGTVGGVYPAWHAAQLPPVEALRYDGDTEHGQALRIPWAGMAIRNLTRQRMRTVLTLVGVGIAIVSMTLIGSLTRGFVENFNGIVSSAEIAVVEKDQPDTSLSVIEERDLKRIEALPQVSYVMGSILSFASTPKSPFLLITARSRTDPVLNQRILKEGHLLNGPRQCLMGRTLATQQERQLGERINVLGTSFKVVGIVEIGSGLEDNGIIIDLREAQRLLNKTNQVMLAEIKLEDPRQTDEMVKRLSEAFPELMFSRSSEFSENLPDMQSMDSLVNGIYVIAAGVGAIALMNTMIMSVFERTREIGVLRAVGWGRARVLRQMLTESVVLTLVSGVIGTVVSWGLVKFLNNLPAMSTFQGLFKLTPDLVIQALVTCAVLGALGGLYPSWRATRFSPVEALRYE